MEGKPPIERLRELGLDLPDEFAAFPVVLLDEMAVTWAAERSRCVGLLHLGAEDFGRGALSGNRAGFRPFVTEGGTPPAG